MSHRARAWFRAAESFSKKLMVTVSKTMNGALRASLAWSHDDRRPARPWLPDHGRARPRAGSACTGRVSAVFRVSDLVLLAQPGQRRGRFALVPGDRHGGSRLLAGWRPVVS
ncbi:MAG: hypothetical protein M0030_13080 [Actinomycetota bacterium]|nr:hypothetical protein [Actinomycetota bacterium]